MSTIWEIDVSLKNKSETTLVLYPQELRLKNKSETTLVLYPQELP